MGRSQESFSKKEKEKKRLKKRKEKQAKKEARKAEPKESSLEDMIAYVDEYGNITDTPPDPAKKEEINAEDIVIGIPKKEKSSADEDGVHKGRVDHYNEKGFGFIKENDSNESYFFHISNLLEDLAEGDKVEFELEQGDRGLNAVRVKKG